MAVVSGCQLEYGGAVNSGYYLSAFDGALLAQRLRVLAGLGAAEAGLDGCGGVMVLGAVLHTHQDC